MLEFKLSKIKEESLINMVNKLEILLEISLKYSRFLYNKSIDIIHEIKDEINEIIFCLQYFNIDTVIAKIEDYNLLNDKDYFTIYTFLYLIAIIILEKYFYISSFKESLEELLVPFPDVNELFEFRKITNPENEKDNKIKLDDNSDKLANKYFIKKIRLSDFFQDIMKARKKQLNIKYQNSEESGPIHTNDLKTNLNVDRNPNQLNKQNLSSKNYAQRKINNIQSFNTNFKEQLTYKIRLPIITNNSYNIPITNVCYICENNNQKKGNKGFNYTRRRTILLSKRKESLKNNYPGDKENMNERKKFKKIKKEESDSFRQTNIKIRKSNNILLFISNKLISIFLLFITIFNQWLPSLCNSNAGTSLQYSTTIILKVIGTGNKFILCNMPNNFNSPQSQTTINGNTQSDNKNAYDFIEENNNITLIWNYPIMNCNYMFYSCSDIVEIDLSQFDASQVNSMESMFSGGSNLTSINFGSINTTSVTNMKSMFEACSKLVSLNLSNFNTSIVTTMENMFYECNNLEYINLSSFVEHEQLNCNNMFQNLQENIVICLNESNENLFSQVNSNINCYTNCCSDDWQIEQIKKIQKNDLCYDEKLNGISYNYEYKGKYYEICENGHLKNNEPTLFCKCDNNNNFFSCPLIPFDKAIYEIENDNQQNVQEDRNCCKEPEGYYLDIDENKYKECFTSCKTCTGEGNDIYHNCLDCGDNFKYEIKKNNHLNCYTECNYYHYFDNNYIFHCTDDFKCPDEFPILVQYRNECTINDTIYYSTDIYKETFSSFSDGISDIFFDANSAKASDSRHIPNEKDSSKLSDLLMKTENISETINLTLLL